ncbi:MAG TPA: Spy/CpxP family protein refolding chaperone [Thermoanaerobaculia bacterium]|nr:Spy/CpxP family protein refolding chaperone [Thermoanaerobaculia bacterium]
MKRFTLLFCLLTLAALAVAPAFAGGPHHAAATAAGTAGPAHHFDHLAKALALTDDQKTAAKPLQDELQATVQPLFADLHQKHQAIKNALDSGADAATVGGLMIAAHATQRQVKAAHDKFSQSFAALLTPDQLQKFQTLQQEHGMGHRGPRGMEQ